MISRVCPARSEVLLKMARRGPDRSLVSLVTTSETSLEGSQCWHRGLYRVATIKAEFYASYTVRLCNPNPQEATSGELSKASLEY